MNRTLIRILNHVRSDLVGRTISDEEQGMLLSKFTYDLFPPYLIEILKNYKIVGQNFSISEDGNPSEIQVEMRWLTPTEQISEAFDCYPGLLVINEGYLPIGMCLMGSGDPYFLKKTDKKDLLVRVPHDAVENGVFDYDSIEFICEFIELFGHLSEL